MDEALCFGWIDGVRRSVDTNSFSTRFTPRKPKSKWSTINIKRAAELLAAGRMHSAGKAAFAARGGAATRSYSYESRPTKLDAGSLKKLRANKRAWSFFQTQPPWYQRTSTFWVMEAKREETRARRLAELLARSAKGEPIKLLDRR
ncbi:MAG: YdeI/OmpD-associated family protein [Gemmatimonadales bacterium]